VNIRIGRITKAALDMFAAEKYAETGQSYTNDMAIRDLLSQVAPHTIERALAASGGKDDDNGNGNGGHEEDED
jgi:hypothetical protein